MKSLLYWVLILMNAAGCALAVPDQPRGVGLTIIMGTVISAIWFRPPAGED